MKEYQRWTGRLIQGLEGDPRVLGLIALGSMAGNPDPYSDHDFFVITQRGEEETFRTDLSWLPCRIALAFRETEHGLKVVTEEGHLLEFAVFTPEELGVARINRFKILLDRIGLEPTLRSLQQKEETAPTDEFLFGMFFTNLLVAVGRARRGESLSGRAFLGYAVGHLVRLFERNFSPTDPSLLDNLDPLRRFEFAYPELGEEVNRALRLDFPEAAEALMNIAQRTLHSHASFPHKGWEAVRSHLLLKSSSSQP